MFSQTSEPSAKRSAGEMQNGEQQAFLDSIRDIVKEENKSLVESFQKRFGAIESRQEQLEHRIEQIERKMGRNPGGGNSMEVDFQPGFLEVKGFCTWADRLAKGATRTDATELMNILTPLLPQELQAQVKPFELRGLRNYSIKIPVAPEVIREVKGIWSDSLKAKRVTGPENCELYVTFQKSQAQRAKYSSMGKLFEFVQETKKESKFKAFWAPDFCIYMEPAEGRPVLVASLGSDNSVVWDSSAQEVLGMSVLEVSELFAAHRRK